MKKIFFTAILAMAAASTWADVEINETTFPDENFRNWVLAQSYGQDGTLTDEEIAGVTTVNVKGNRKIQSLKGVECFTALTSLECGLNQLTALDLSKNTALTLLFCSRNQLTTLNVSACTALENLRCDENRLSTLEVSGCSELEEILCYSNQINGGAMDALVEGLPVTRSECGHLPVISLEGEQNVMTKSQVAAARAKGWRPRYKYGSFSTMGWTDYEGSDDATAFASPLGETGEGAAYDLQGRKMVNGQRTTLNGQRPRIYIRDGKKIARY